MFKAVLSPHYCLKMRHLEAKMSSDQVHLFPGPILCLIAGNDLYCPPASCFLVPCLCSIARTLLSATTWPTAIHWGTDLSVCFGVVNHHCIDGAAVIASVVEIIMKLNSRCMPRFAKWVGLQRLERSCNFGSARKGTQTRYRR